jgi:hypothetical protein
MLFNIITKYGKQYIEVYKEELRRKIRNDQYNLILMPPEIIDLIYGYILLDGNCKTIKQFNSTCKLFNNIAKNNPSDCMVCVVCDNCLTHCQCVLKRCHKCGTNGRISIKYLGSYPICNKCYTSDSTYSSFENLDIWFGRT